MAIHKPPPRVGASPFTEGDLVREQLILPAVHVRRNLRFAKSPFIQAAPGAAHSCSGFSPSILE